jgi:hypothetical protein
MAGWIQNGVSFPFPPNDQLFGLLLYLVSSSSTAFLNTSLVAVSHSYVFIFDDLWIGALLFSPAPSIFSYPSPPERHYVRRLCTGRNREAAVILLFGLVSFSKRVSRAQSSADLSLLQPLAAIGSCNDQNS